MSVSVTSRSVAGICAALVLTLAASAALAQATSTPSQSGAGLGPTATHPGQVDKGQNMILPSAGQSAPSAAPTMVYDCKANPQDCTTPATPADKATAPEISAPPATSAPKP